MTKKYTTIEGWSKPENIEGIGGISPGGGTGGIGEETSGILPEGGDCISTETI